MNAASGRMFWGWWFLKNHCCFDKDLVKVHQIPSSEIMQQEKCHQQEESSVKKSVADECKNEQ